MSDYEFHQIQSKDDISLEDMKEFIEQHDYLLNNFIKLVQENKQLKTKLSDQVIYSAILHKALTNVSKCPVSDLTKYLIAVDGIAMDALCRHEDPAIDLRIEIKADAIRQAAKAVFNQFNKWGKAQIFLNEYASEMESGVFQK